MTEQQKHEFEESGFILLENFLTPEEVVRLSEAADEVVAPRLLDLVLDGFLLELGLDLLLDRDALLLVRLGHLLHRLRGLPDLPRSYARGGTVADSGGDRDARPGADRTRDFRVFSAGDRLAFECAQPRCQAGYFARSFVGRHCDLAADHLRHRAFLFGRGGLAMEQVQLL